MNNYAQEVRMIREHIFGGQYICIRDNQAFGAYQEAVEQLGANLKQGMDNFLTGQLVTFESAAEVGFDIRPRC